MEEAITDNERHQVDVHRWKTNGGRKTNTAEGHTVGGGENDERQIHAAPQETRLALKSEAWNWKGSSCSEVPKKRINPMFTPPPHTARQVLLQRGRDRGVEMEQNSSYAPAFTNTSPFPPRALDCWKPVIQPPGKRLENSPEKWMDPADVGIWGSTSENSSSQLNHPRLQDPVR